MHEANELTSNVDFRKVYDCGMQQKPCIL